MKKGPNEKPPARRALAAPSLQGLTEAVGQLETTASSTEVAGQVVRAVVTDSERQEIWSLQNSKFDAHN